MLKIIGIHFKRLTVPLKTPFKTAVRSVDCLDDLVVILKTDGELSGFGSAPSTPMITGETHQTIETVIKSHIFPAIKDNPIEAIDVNCRHTQNAIVGNASAKAAVEIALYDLWSKYLGLPLYKALGGTVSELKTDYTISANSLDTMINDCNLAIDAGYDCLKLKIGTDFKSDKLALQHLYKQFAGKATLRLDVNQGWSEAQTIQALSEFERDGIEFELVEQPVAADNINGMISIAREINTPVMADESCKSLNDVSMILANKAADIINIKLMKCGGISTAINIAKLTNEYGKAAMMGCMLEGSISVAAAAHLAAAYSREIKLVDLDGPTLGKYDPIMSDQQNRVNSATFFETSNIKLNQTPGLGIIAV